MSSFRIIAYAHLNSQSEIAYIHLNIMTDVQQYLQYAGASLRFPIA